MFLIWKYKQVCHILYSQIVKPSSQSYFIFSIAVSLNDYLFCVVESFQVYYIPNLW